MKHTSRFDLDIPAPLLDPSYAPSLALLRLIERMARIESVGFRFWAAMTMKTNLESISPCAEAEEVIIDVVENAIECGAPTDGAYQLIIGDDGKVVGVAFEDGWLNPIDDDEAYVHGLVSFADIRNRYEWLVELARLCALTQQDVSSARLEQHSCWRTAT